MVSEFNVISNMIINTNDRVSIFGRTGSGKTFFSKNWLLPHYDNYVFWDIKHENIDAIHNIIITSPKDLKKVLANPTKKLTPQKILYQPEVPTDKDFNDICEIIFENKNTALYVDEASAITSPTKILYWHKVIVTQGRSYNVGIINASQRPRDVHNSLISESEHLFVFSLNLETDINKVRQQIGDAADEIRYLPEHHFLYYSVRANKSFIFKPIKKYSIDEKTGEIKIPKLELYQPKIEEYISLIS